MTTSARRLIALLVITSLASGCTGYRSIAVGSSRLSHRPVAPGRVAAGETVRVELRDGTTRTITIKAVDADALVGKRGERISRAQIVTVTRPSSAATRSALLVVGTLFAIMLLQLIAYAHEE